jgi:hypothetical protein
VPGHVVNRRCPCPVKRVALRADTRQTRWRHAA